MFNLEEKKKKLKELSEKNRTRQELPEGMKKCPFQSAVENIPCGPDCALFRSTKQTGYNCPFTELTSMSWVMNGSKKSKKYNQN